MLFDEPCRPGLVVGVRPLPTCWFRADPGGRVGDDEFPGLAANGFRAALDEPDDGIEDFRRGVEIAAMHAHLGSVEADHHTGVFRELQLRDGLQPAAAKQLEEAGFSQLLLCVWRDVQIPRPARDDSVEQSELHPLLQRLKHRAGPATKFFSFSAQMSVDTSISVGVMRMRLTDDGRPPRDRFEMVPAVETTVPRLVCSM